MLLLHGDNVDLGPGLQDGQLLQGGGAFVVAAGAGPLLQFGEGGDQELVDASKIVKVTRHTFEYY